MRFGVVVPQALAWSRWLESVRWAEDVGYDVMYDYDHLTHFTVPGEWLADGFGYLAAAAASTTRIELGTLVASATFRSPVALARIASTVDEISGGRLVLGLGAGSPTCSAADRDEHPTPREMADRFADVVAGYRAVMVGAQSWQGATMAFSGLETTPLPEGSRSPYLLIAAHGPRAIRVAVEHGDGWNTYGGPARSQDDAQDFWATLARQSDAVTAECERQGRDPSTLRRSLLLGFGTVRPTDSVAAYVDAAHRAEDLGFDEIVVYGPAAPPADRFASDPAVHAAALERLGSSVPRGRVS